MMTVTLGRVLGTASLDLSAVVASYWF